MNAEIIAINDLKRHIDSVSGPIRIAIERVLANGWFVLGPECRSFERDFATYCGSLYCISVANGTDALEIALRTLGIGRGKRVATVANAGFYATTAIAQVEATPVYIDVEPATRLMNLAALEALAQAREIDAVIITHLFGLMHDMRMVRLIADRAEIRLIEDCAQAHGASRDGRRVGSVGDISCFSFYPTKNLGALGDAGAILTNDDGLARRAESLRQYGWSSKYHVTNAGGRNSRMDELQAAVLSAQLPFLDAWNERRLAIANYYTKNINNPRVKCPCVSGPEFVSHLYVIECDDRQNLQKKLLKNGIMCDIHYPIPDHRQETLSDRTWPRLVVTEFLASRVLTIPCFPELRDDEITRIIANINSW